jgi:hypothetical protein
MIIKEIFWKSDLALVTGFAHANRKPVPLPDFPVQSAPPRRAKRFRNE